MLALWLHQSRQEKYMTLSCRRLMTSGFAFGLVVALNAQTPTSAQTKSTMPAEITVTGCVERADQVSAPAAVGTTVDSLSFVLIKATKGTATDSRTAGTSGTKASTETASMYRLDAAVSTLNPHVGHKVEVIGTLDAASATTAAPADPPSATTAPKLVVNRVKMISDTCAR
jgi:hypothetical protein